MGGFLESEKVKLLNKAQNNLIYIVSYFFTQDKSPPNNQSKNPFIMCQPTSKKEDKSIKSYPLTSFKFEDRFIKYTKYEYRQINVLQMIMLTPEIFVSLTDEGLQLWYESYGIQKISAQFFDKLKNINKSEIRDKKLTKFNNDLFFLTFTMIPNSYFNNNQSNNKLNLNDLQGLQFVLFSAKKIITEGKITELFSINKLDFVFPINENQLFTINKREIKILDITEKKIIKTDKNLEILKFPISFAKHLFEDFRFKQKL